MKNKNEITPIEKFKKTRNSGYALKGAKWVSILSPYIVIGAINFEEYFTEVNGVKMSLGCTLALIVAGISIYNETKANGENKKINGIVGWAVAFALAYLLQSILSDLVLILGAGLIGQMVGAGFDLGANAQLTKANIYKESLIKAEAYNNNITDIVKD